MESEEEQGSKKLFERKLHNMTVTQSDCERARLVANNKKDNGKCCCFTL